MKSFLKISFCNLLDLSNSIKDYSSRPQHSATAAPSPALPRHGEGSSSAEPNEHLFGEPFLSKINTKSSEIGSPLSNWRGAGGEAKKEVVNAVRFKYLTPSKIL